MSHIGGKIGPDPLSKSPNVCLELVSHSAYDWVYAILAYDCSILTMFIAFIMYLIWFTKFMESHRVLGVYQVYKVQQP